MAASDFRAEADDHASTPAGRQHRRRSRWLEYDGTEAMWRPRGHPAPVWS